MEIKRRNYKTVDWKPYKNIMLSNIREVYRDNMKSLETKHELFDIISNTDAKITIILRTTIIIFEIYLFIQLVAKRKSALTKFIRSASLNDYIEFKRATAKAKNYLKYKLKSQWYKYCEILLQLIILQMFGIK